MPGSNPTLPNTLLPPLLHPRPTTLPLAPLFSEKTHSHSTQNQKNPSNENNQSTNIPVQPSTSKCNSVFTMIYASLSRIELETSIRTWIVRSFGKFWVVSRIFILKISFIAIWNQRMCVFLHFHFANADHVDLCWWYQARSRRLWTRQIDRRKYQTHQIRFGYRGFVHWRGHISLHGPRDP